LYVGVGVLVAIAAVGAALALGRSEPRAAIPSVADAGTPTTSRPVAIPPPVIAVAADAAVEAAQVDAGSPEADAGDTVQTPVAPVASPVARTGTVEFRIRPYATVWIDGKQIGDTPLPPQVLGLGKHRVRLVNTELGKDVVQEFTVHPGENTLKHNFKE
jgi:serine/threonine-protein kinase